MRKHSFLQVLNINMKKFKVFIMVLVSIITIEILSFNFYGKRILVNKHFDKIENYNYHKGVLGVYHNIDLFSGEKAEIEGRLRRAC